MNRFTKILVLIIIEIIIGILFLGISDLSALTVVIFFPPIFAITIYFLFITGADLKNRKVITTNVILALLFASIALFSTSIGFHYASDDINNLFISLNDQKTKIFSEDIQRQINLVNERLYFLDELFSHWIMMASIIGVGLSLIIWYVLSHRKELEDINKVEANKVTIISIFIPVFLGTFAGTLAALFSIEAHVIGYGTLVISLITPFVIIKNKRKLIGFEGKQQVSFILTLLGAYLATALAFFILSNGIFPSYWVNIGFR